MIFIGLWDALRKTIQISAQFCNAHELTEWRQSCHLLRTLKKSYRLIQKLKHSTSKDEAKRQAKQDEINEAHQVYIDQAQRIVQRARTTSQLLKNNLGVPSIPLAELEDYLIHADRQIDQIRRRVLQGETIPHDEKVFSLFQPSISHRITSLFTYSLYSSPPFILSHHITSHHSSSTIDSSRTASIYLPPSSFPITSHHIKSHHIPLHPPRPFMLLFHIASLLTHCIHLFPPFILPHHIASSFTHRIHSSPPFILPVYNRFMFVLLIDLI